MCSLNSLTPWLCGPLRTLVCLIMDAHSSLSTAFCHHLLTFISCGFLHVFHPSQSRSLPSTSVQFTLKTCFNFCSIQTQYIPISSIEIIILVTFPWFLTTVIQPASIIRLLNNKIFCCMEVKL